MPNILMLLGGLVLAATLGLVWRAWGHGSAEKRVGERYRGDPCAPACSLGERLLVALTPLFIFLSLMALLIGMKGHCEDWDAARLAVSVAFVRGWDVYSGLSEGAIHTTMYPPGWVLAFVPVALGRTPAGVMSVGSLLATFYFLLPLLCLRPLLGMTRVAVWLSSACFLFLAAQLESLRWACFSPHADAPALGFGLLALLVLQARGRGGALSCWRLLATAVCAGLAVWCKQTMLPLPVGMVLWLLLQRQPARALQLCGCLALVAVVLAGLSLAFFDFESLWLNLVVIPGRHAWRGQMPFNLLRALLDLLPVALIATGVLIANTVLAAICLPRGTLGVWVRGSVWAPAVLVALLLLPMALMAFVKVGGAMNSLSPVHYFLFGAAILQSLELWRALIASRVVVALPALAAGLAGFLAVIGLFWWLQTLQELRYGIHDFRTSLAQQAYRYLRTTPTPKVYFPAYPLAHLLAEGHWPHYVNAMVDREQHGKVPIGEDQRRAGMPAEAAVVAWTARQFSSEHGRGRVYFSEFTEPIAIPGLEEFRCYEVPMASKEH